MKRIFSILLTISMILTMMSVTQHDVMAESKTLIVHYQRGDDDYKDWNLWLWEDSGEGTAVEFEFEDDFGVVLVANMSASTTTAGFIVRTNNWDKDVSEDRFIDLNDGVTEIWLYSEDATIYSEVPEGYEPYDLSAVEEVQEEVNLPINEDGEYTVRVHYHRFDEEYSGWNLWLWPYEGEGAAYPLDQSDEFGKYSTIVVPGSAGVDQIGVIVRLNEWEAKDVPNDIYFSTSKVGEDGVIDVYLVQGDATVHYSLDDVDLSPTFLNADLSDAESVDITVTVPFELTEVAPLIKLMSANGETILAKNLTSLEGDGAVTTATVIFEQELKANENYILSMEGYGEIGVNMSKVFDMPSFEDNFFYDGDDLGASYDSTGTTFKLWAPTASTVSVRLYETGIDGEMIDEIIMDAEDKGVYSTTVGGDLNGVYYTYAVEVAGSTNEAVDPYATAVGVNGDRGLVLDLDTTNPEGWDQDQRPAFEGETNAIVYELHIRDLSMSETSGIENKGKFLGLTESGTTNDAGLSTGLDHLKELGITHLQLLPVFDYRSIDETSLEDNEFNWGYDPKNYNAVEGSYSTDPYDGALRIQEYKETIQTLHENDIRVIMDVVYNHTGASHDSHLNKLVPNYYYRLDGTNFSNGSGCGNETASERAMVSKMIVDSVVFWAEEYHIDGFRFDLMGLHDLETMQAVRDALDEIDPTIIVYGEGWTGGSSPLSETERAVKANTFMLDGIGAFSDDLRDGIKGHVFSTDEPGFVNGFDGLEESIKFGVVGAVEHHQINYADVNYSSFPWADEPGQSINYAEAHDNHTLWDKLIITNPDDDIETLKYMDKMSGAIFLTSQGVPFIHAGMEFLRSKDGDHNSYKSPDEVNMIDWDLKTENINVFNYYKGLIELRKAHPAFRMETATEIQENIIFYGMDSNYGDFQLPTENMVAYMINNNANGDTAGSIIVIFNAEKEAMELEIPAGEWKQVSNKEVVDLNGLGTIDSGVVNVNGLETVILINEEAIAVTDELTFKTINEEVTEETTEEVTEETTEETTKQSGEETSDDSDEADDKTSSLVLPIVLGIVAIAGVAYFLLKRKSNKKK